MIPARYFKFKNIKIGNSGHYILQGVTALESGTAKKNAISYIDTDGESYRDIFYNPRNFEIQGFIFADTPEEMVRLKRELISQCSLKEPFELEYFNREHSYFAKCYFDELPSFEKRQGWNMVFKLYLVIPDFYWTSALISQSLSNFKNLIFDTFTLPCVFTQSTIGAISIEQNGDCPTYPTFLIDCEQKVLGSYIVISNLTTNKKIRLNYEADAGETIIIDCNSSTVISSTKGNIANALSIDSDFFPLICGTNQLKCETNGNNVLMTYKDRFLGV